MAAARKLISPSKLYSHPKLCLPVEVWMLIGCELDPVSNACLALASPSMNDIFKEFFRRVMKIPPLRMDFLARFDREYRHLFLCCRCMKWHPWKRGHFEFSLAGHSSPCHESHVLFSGLKFYIAPCQAAVMRAKYDSHGEALALLREYAGPILEPYHQSGWIILVMPRFCAGKLLLKSSATYVIHRLDLDVFTHVSAVVCQHFLLPIECLLRGLLRKILDLYRAGPGAVLSTGTHCCGECLTEYTVELGYDAIKSVLPLRLKVRINRYTQLGTCQHANDRVWRHAVSTDVTRVRYAARPDPEHESLRAAFEPTEAPEQRSVASESIMIWAGPDSRGNIPLPTATQNQQDHIFSEAFLIHEHLFLPNITALRSLDEILYARTPIAKLMLAWDTMQMIGLAKPSTDKLHEQARLERKRTGRG